MPVSAVWCFGRADPIRISNGKRTAHGLVLSLASRVSTLASVLPLAKEENRGRVAWDAGLGLSMFLTRTGRDSHPTAAGAIRARVRE